MIARTFARVLNVQYSGRQNRSQYLLACLTLSALFFMVTTLMDFFLSPLSVYVPMIGMGLMIAIILLWVPQGIERLHDIGKPGSMMLLYAVPLVNMIFSFYLMFAPGEAEENDYGEAPDKIPPKEEWLLIIGLLVFSLVVLILPTYLKAN